MTVFLSFRGNRLHGEFDNKAQRNPETLSFITSGSRKSSLMHFRVEFKKKKLLYNHYFVAMKELVVFFKDPFPFPIQKNT